MWGHCLIVDEQSRQNSGQVYTNGVVRTVELPALHLPHDNQLGVSS